MAERTAAGTIISFVYMDTRMCTQALRQARGQQRAEIEGQKMYYYSNALFLTTENSLNFQLSQIKDYC